MATGLRPRHADRVPAPRPTTVTFSCWGHPAVRGTHGKTVELTAEPEITARATCVVGVRADVDGAELAGFSGPVSIALRAAQYEEVLHATAHAGFRPGGRLVIRRSPHRSAETFANRADRAAKDLSRELLAALRQPDTRLLVTVRGQRSPLGGAKGALWLVAVPEGEPGAFRERLARASLLAGGEPAREAVRAGGLEVEVAGPDGAGRRRALAELRAGRPVALALRPTLGRLGRAEQSLVAEALGAGHKIEAVGLPPELTALLVSGFELGAPVLLAGSVAAMDGLPAGAVALCRLPARSLERALGVVESWDAEVPVCAVLEPAEPVESALKGRAVEVRALARDATPRRGDVLLVVAPRAGGGTRSTQPPKLLASLLREGVPEKTLVRALASTPGWGRRRAEAAVQALTSAAPPSPGRERRSGPAARSPAARPGPAGPSPPGPAG